MIGQCVSHMAFETFPVGQLKVDISVNYAGGEELLAQLLGKK